MGYGHPGVAAMLVTVATESYIAVYFNSLARGGGDNELNHFSE